MDCSTGLCLSVFLILLIPHYPWDLMLKQAYGTHLQRTAATTLFAFIMLG